MGPLTQQRKLLPLRRRTRTLTGAASRLHPAPTRTVLRSPTRTRRTRTRPTRGRPRNAGWRRNHWTRARQNLPERRRTELIPRSRAATAGKSSPTRSRVGGAEGGDEQHEQETRSEISSNGHWKANQNHSCSSRRRRSASPLHPSACRARPKAPQPPPPPDHPPAASRLLAFPFTVCNKSPVIFFYADIYIF